MPSRFIKESIWTSPNLARLSPRAELHFYRLLPLPDDFGCFESTPNVVRGRCYPLNEGIRPTDIQKWQDEMEQNDLIYRWQVSGREFAIFPTWKRHQYIRGTPHKRKTPEPPQSIMDKCERLLSENLPRVTETYGELPQVTETIGLIPIPTPIHNPIEKEIYKEREIFDLWNSLGMIKHKKLTGDMKRALVAALRDFPAAEISQAMKNYAQIVNDEQCFFKYRWTLKDFLKRGLDKFLDLEVAIQNYHKDRRINDKTTKLPRQYKTPEEHYGEEYKRRKQQLEAESAASP